MLRARKRASTPYFSTVFSLDSHLSPLKSLGVHRDDPLKPKIMKLTYTKKVTFNINGITMHFALAISLNKILTKLNALNDEKCDTFIKTYDQFCLLVIDEISLVGNRMLSFIYCRLCVIKQVQNEFMGGLDVIMTNDFYQALLVLDSWIFKPIIYIFNSITINYWSKYAPCYELKQIM